ncbi:MAG: PQQ-dependent sugar dehydrogenase [Candidatus Nanopelagicales bacterium]|nr:PQQ-dependent sugar dehydrogenase [Candidatus Nanopelagicales bacterium]
MRHRIWGPSWALCGALLLAACTGQVSSDPTPAPGSVSASPTGPAEAETPAASASPSDVPQVTGVAVDGTIGGFDRPWDVRFLPDGTPLVTERPGTIATVVDGRRQFVAEVPGVVARGEGGLMGLAVDPDFGDNRHIFLCFASGSGGRVSDVRVVRFRVTEDLDGLTDATALVTGIPAGAGNRHLGCRVEIGPDRMLWVTTGDAVLPSAPQDPRNRAGKVLRATLTGEPAPGNPGGRWDPYVFTLGHRNVQGLSFRPGDGAAFAVEHGTGCDDEINLLARGANYGWDPVGPGGQYAESAPMTSPDAEGAVPAVWSSGCPTIAPSGGEFITGATWGSWVGALAVAVLKDEELMVVSLAGDEAIGTASYLSGDLGRLRTVRNAPDGSLWLTVDSSPGELVRIIPETE